MTTNVCKPQKFYKANVYIDDTIDYKTNEQKNEKFYILKNIFGQLKIVTRSELEDWIK